jgi:hypothetical protein
VYEIPLGGTIMKQKFALGGSGSSYIYGLVDATYRDNMSKEECKEFVKKAISHAMARDGSSGGVIRLVVIDKDGVEKECILGELRYLNYYNYTYKYNYYYICYYTATNITVISTTTTTSAMIAATATYISTATTITATTLYACMVSDSMHEMCCTYCDVLVPLLNHLITTP